MDPVNLMDGSGGSPFCTAKSKRSGERCRRRVPGGGVCNIHGGKAPQVARQREARLAAAEAVAMFADVHEPRDPGEALASAAVNADQVLRSLQQRVELSGELRAHDLEALRTWMELVSRLSKAVLDARIDERRTQLSEKQGALVAGLFRAVFADPMLALTSAQAAVGAQVAARHLRALASGDQRVLEVGATR